MPCSDGGYSQEYLDQQDRFKKTMTRLACDRCKELIAREGGVPDWATEWWEHHQAADKERQRTDAKVRKEAQIRKQAIAKLTPEERAELGV